LRYLIVRSANPAHHAQARAAFGAYAACGVLDVTLAPGGARPVTVLAEHPNPEAIRPRVPVHFDERELVLYDGLPLHRDFDAFDARALAVNWSKTDRCVGRFAMVRGERDSGRVEVRLDATASAAVYRADLPGGGEGAVLLTSVPRLAHQLAPRGDLDPMGVAGLLCSATPMGLRTLTTAVTVLPHAAVVELGPDGSERVKQVEPMTQAGKQRCDLPAETAAREFAAYYTPILSRMEEAGFEMRSALTGGRDSRAAAALLGASVKHLKVRFGGTDGGKETQIVQRAAEAMQAELLLRTEPFSPGKLNYPVAERYLMDRDCGLELLTRVRNPPEGKNSPEFNREVTLGGHAGEIARWSFESLTGMIKAPSVEASRHRVISRILSSGSGMYTPEPYRLACGHVNAMVDSAVDGGVTDINLQTVVVNLLKAPRWGCMQMARLAEKYDPVTPFFTEPFLMLAMRISPTERFRDKFHYELIRQCRPGGLTTPFHTYRNVVHRLGNELVREGIIRSSTVKKFVAKRRPPHVNATWEPWIRPIFREQVAGHDRGSPVWAYIDRATLESKLSGPDEFRASFYEVYKAMTVIRFWDWYTELTASSSTVARAG
jgi:hypothetical protein